MNPNDYFDSQVAARSMLVSSSDNHNDQTISFETQTDLCIQNLASLIVSDPSIYIEHIHKLCPEDQDILFSYFFLDSSQSTIAHVLGTNQTTISRKLRMAVLRLGSMILIGIPSKEDMHDILEKVDHANFTSTVEYAEIINLYATHGSENKLITLTGLKRTAIRKELSDLSIMLIDNQDRYVKALGAYVSGLVEHRSTQKISDLNKRGPYGETTTFVDPDIVGKFEIDVTDKDFDSLFIPTAKSLTGDLSGPRSTIRGPARDSTAKPEGRVKSLQVDKSDAPISVATAPPVGSPQPMVSALSGSAIPIAALGDRLRQLRHAWGLSQGELARMINSNQKSVSHWEQGRHHPRVAVFDALARLTGNSREAWRTGVDFTIPERAVTDLCVLKKFDPKGITVVVEPIPKGQIGILDLDSPDTGQESITPSCASERLLREHRAGRLVWLVVSSS